MGKGGGCVLWGHLKGVQEPAAGVVHLREGGRIATVKERVEHRAGEGEGGLGVSLSIHGLMGWGKGIGRASALPWNKQQASQASRMHTHTAAAAAAATAPTAAAVAAVATAHAAQPRGYVGYTHRRLHPDAQLLQLPHIGRLQPECVHRALPREQRKKVMSQVTTFIFSSARLCLCWSVILCKPSPA